MSLAVRPECRRTGIASQLVAEFLSDLRRRGVDAVNLTTDRNDNDGANTFYRNFGFTLRRSFTTREGREMNEYVKRV
jgi:ribosomal protein S18 acetylase RimI-like enzyme